MKRILCLPDVHLTLKVPKPYEVVKRFLKTSKTKFDEIIIMGDFMDLESLSFFNKGKPRLMENKRFEKECKLANDELDFLQKYCNKITFLNGNHERRIESYLDEHPELEGIIDINVILKFKERKINHIKENVLYKVGKLHFTHGIWYNKYHANKHLEVFGCNIVYCHTHKPQTTMLHMATHKPTMAYGLGTLGDLAPQWMRNKPSNWINQFAIVDTNERNGQFNVYPINIINNKFIYNGIEYK